MSIFNPPLPSKDHSHVTWGRTYGCSKGLALANAVEQFSGLTLIITPDIQTAHTLESELTFFCKQGIEIYLFPDSETFAPYDVPSRATLDQFGGRVVARGTAEEIHGTASHPLGAILEFKDKKTALAWYRSDAYQALVPIREESASAAFLLYEGLFKGGLSKNYYDWRYPGVVVYSFCIFLCFR